MKPKIACVGQTTLDFIKVIGQYPNEGDVIPVAQSCEVLGGPIGRGAVTAARLGADVHLLSTCGDDGYAKTMQQAIQEEGISAKWAVRKSTPSQHSIVVLHKDNRTILWTPQPKADTETLALLPDVLQGSQCVLMDCTDEQLTTRVAELASQENIPTVLDTSSYKPWVEKLFAKISYIISPRKFFEQRSPELPLEAALEQAYNEFAPKLWSYTDGAKGGKYIADETADEIRSFEAVSVTAVDTCGAGDTFHGAFAVAIANRLALGEAFRFSAWAAAMKCQELGNTSIPDQSAAAKILAPSSEPYS